MTRAGKNIANRAAAIGAEIDRAADEELATGMLTPDPAGILFWAGVLVFCEYRRNSEAQWHGAESRGG